MIVKCLLSTAANIFGMHRVRGSTRQISRQETSREIPGHFRRDVRLRSRIVVWLAEIAGACCKRRTIPHRSLRESREGTPIRRIKFVNSDLRHFQGTEHRVHVRHFSGERWRRGMKENAMTRQLSAPVWRADCNYCWWTGFLNARQGTSVRKSAKGSRGKCRGDLDRI